MPKMKIAITLERAILEEVDRLVSLGTFANRSRAIESAVYERVSRLSGGRLARECAKLDPAEERAFAEQGMEAELDQWPEY
jgi:Arc/MetJ-type ribon-helix-helix transcriptional regulator